MKATLVTLAVAVASAAVTIAAEASPLPASTAQGTAWRVLSLRLRASRPDCGTSCHIAAGKPGNTVAYHETYGAFANAFTGLILVTRTRALSGH